MYLMLPRWACKAFVPDARSVNAVRWVTGLFLSYFVRDIIGDIVRRPRDNGQVYPEGFSPLINDPEYSRIAADQGRALARLPLFLWLVAALLASIALTLSPGASLLRLAAGWLLLYLLPGLTLCCLLDRRADLLEQVILGMAASPAVVSVVLYLTAGLMKLPIFVSLIIAGLIFTGLILFTFLRRDSISVPRPNLPGTMVFLAAGIFAGLVICYYLKWPSSLISYHGLFHTATIHQVMNGIIPPHNVHLYGAPASYQWPCYLLPATTCLLTGASPPVVAAILRVSTFLGIFGMGYLMARHLGHSAAGRALSGLFSALGMSLLSGVHYLVSSLTLPELRYALFHGQYNPQLKTLFSPGILPVHIQVHTSTLVQKLINFSFIFPGFISVMIALLGFILVLQGKGRKGYALAGIGTLGALLIHPVMAAVLAAPLPLALILLRLINRSEQSVLSWRRVFALTGCFAVAGLAALPYLVPAMASGGRGIATGISLKVVLALLWAYSPLGLLAAIRIPRRSRPVSAAEKLLFLFAFLIALFITIHQLRCWWYMLYLITIPLGLLAGDAAGRWYDWITRHWMRWGLCLVLIFLAFSGPLLWLNCSTLSQLEYTKAYQVFGGAMIELSEENSDLATTYRWIRENTQPEDVLVEWPRDHSREELAALSGRRVYVGKPSNHTPPAGDPRMSSALALVTGLLDPTLSEKGAALDRLAALPDTAYLVLTRKSVGWRFPPLARIYAEYPERLELCLDLPEAKVYRILPE
ncbi:MAG: hypothetical protein GY849_15345 [Deltaproteobacteria bacterium]|nr:hypothetical protein [Deltaproteobacteria bacterium]